MTKIGFACKYMHADRTLTKKALQEIEGKYNCKTTTATWMAKQDKQTQLLKLDSIIKHNIKAINYMLGWLSNQPPVLRMFRLSSDILPLYTHKDFKHLYDDPMFKYIKPAFKSIGEIARYNLILLSFHPGQYTVLSSDKPHVIENAIREFEYHTDIARWMGYGRSFQDGCKINIHVGGKGGPKKLVETYHKLSPEARNLITVENDEMTWGLEDCLSISETIPVVLDIHHHWVKTGEYIKPDDDRVKQVIESWRGVTPTMHYSVSPFETIGQHCNKTKPDIEELMKSGLKKGKLRAHSNEYWNRACNDWALGFLGDFNIMCESKYKNLSAQALYKQYLKGRVQQHQLISVVNRLDIKS